MFMLTIVFGGLFTACLLFYWFTKYVTYKTWKRRGVYSREPTFPLGNVSSIVMGKEYGGTLFASIYQEAKDKNIKHAGFYLLNTPAYIPTDLEVLKHILVKDFNVFIDRGFYVNEKRDPLSGHLFFLEGQRWKNLRAKLSPTFTSGKMKTMFNIVRSISFEMVGLLDKLVENDQPIDSKDIFSRYTIDVIGNIAFGIECNSLKNEKAKFRLMGQRVLRQTVYESIRDFLAATYTTAFGYLGIRSISKDISDFYINLANEIVSRREETGSSRNDFIQLLINLKHNKISHDENHNEEEETKLSVSDTNGSLNLTNNEIAAQSFVFFVAGFETSSSAINFCIYELCKNVEIQEKLRDEVNSFITSNNGEITYEAIMKAPYLDKVMSETLRKYPTLGFVTRLCNQTYKMPNSDLVLNKGTKVFVPILGIHKDPEFYPEPEKFDPERFSDENKQKRSNFCYLPFGEGPRICIGMRFGLMQAKIGLVQIVKNYRFKLNPKTIEPIQFLERSFVLATKNPFWVDFEKI